MIKITQILNNNVVIAQMDGREVIALGHGLGYRHSKNDRIDQSEIVKVFRPGNNPMKDKLLASIDSLPFDVIEMASEIVEMAEKQLKRPMEHSVLLPLADHINYAVQRYKKGVQVPLIIDEEIKRFYKQEYEIGIQVVALINEKYHVHLNQEEASAIAFHIINGTEGSSISETTKILDGVNQIVCIISKDMDKVFNEEELDYSRLIIHLRFLLKKILLSSGQDNILKNDDMYKNLLMADTRVSKCLDDVSDYCKLAYQYELSENDRLYLMIHILKNR